MEEKIEYLTTALDFYLAKGMGPANAWTQALMDYAYVYHDDEHLPLTRAVEIIDQREKGE